MHERRQGFVNNFGVPGALRRDEDDTVTERRRLRRSAVAASPALSLTLGVRTSQVHYESDDHYVTRPNPDDSGSRTYHNTSPIAGVVWHAARRPQRLRELRARLRDADVRGARVQPGRPRAQLRARSGDRDRRRDRLKWLPAPRSGSISRVFATDTEAGDRDRTPRPAAARRSQRGQHARRGVEAAWDGDLARASPRTRTTRDLLARVRRRFTSGHCRRSRCPPGSRLPGVPPQQAYGELTWTPGGYYGFNAAVEVQYVGSIYVNDRNTAFAPAYTIGNAARRLRAERGARQVHGVRAREQLRRRELRRAR